jgi:hypothetical protein
MQLIMPQRDPPMGGQSHSDHHYVGHAHFWERAMLSRRQFMTAAAGTTGVVLGSGLWMPGIALAHGKAPRPIPGGLQPFGPGTEVFHIFLPGQGAEPSTITDFHGSIGIAETQGTGTGTDTRTGTTTSLIFDNDTRFMKGVYIGVDGEKHTGTFGFI